MSEEVNLYIKISRESPRPGAGSYIAILEATTESGKTGTLTIKKQFDRITPHQLEIHAINDALHRFKRHVEVSIHSEHGWFETIRTRGWFEKWQKNSWFVKGKRAAGAEVLEEIWMVENVCGITILSTDKDLGTFKTWLDAEIEREGDKMKSIIPQEDGTCWLCQRLELNPRYFRKGELDTHHVFYGTANRRQSEKYGLKVKLCKDHHTDGKKAVHRDPITDDYLKRYSQKLFEEKYSHEKFMEVFGKSWL